MVHKFLLGWVPLSLSFNTKILFINVTALVNSFEVKTKEIKSKQVKKLKIGNSFFNSHMTNL